MRSEHANASNEVIQKVAAAKRKLMSFSLFFSSERAVGTSGLRHAGPIQEPPVLTVGEHRNMRPSHHTSMKPQTTHDLGYCQVWELRIHENGPCGAEGEEKARYPQGLRGTVDVLIISCSASPDQG